MNSADNERRCAQFRVSGRVQGVFYRASTEEMALQLGVTGWVRNGIDGGVEVIACGTPAQLDALEQWLQRGPPAARVSAVHRRAIPWQALAGFEIRR